MIQFFNFVLQIVSFFNAGILVSLRVFQGDLDKVM